MSYFSTLADLSTLPIWPGVLARVVDGERAALAVVELAPDSVVAEHQHPNEQIGIVLEGLMTLTVRGERRALRPGDAYSIPGNVPHDAVAGPEGAVVIDVFTPPREDWRRVEPGAPRRPVWP